jgi:hypothetical protein
MHAANTTTFPARSVVVAPGLVELLGEELAPHAAISTVLAINAASNGPLRRAGNRGRVGPAPVSITSLLRPQPKKFPPPDQDRERRGRDGQSKAAADCACAKRIARVNVRAAKDPAIAVATPGATSPATTS